MFNLLSDQILGLPLWAFIVIIIGVVLLIAIIVLAIVLAKKSRKNGGKEKTSETKSVKEEKQDEKPKAASKPAETKQTKTAESKPAAAKSTSKVYHISKRKEDGMWQIKAAGGEKAIKLFKTQKEAISYCKTLADNQDASIMIHKEDGSFRKLTY